MVSGFIIFNYLVLAPFGDLSASFCKSLIVIGEYA
nr:MAG TPA: hypothetical protein [Caudoviricetes sp.]DAV60247.1 MAG TPA: hypothetical protein [Caudoviricetes sp.]DAX00347.1 MAG TPA: hypothetical protein [Bacteriophage sp.]